RKDWHLWFQAQGIDEIGSSRGPAFDDSSLLLKAVLAGQGAGLLPAAMAALDLAEGRLVKLADVAWPEAFAYYLVYPEISHDRPKVAAFRTWILDAAAREGMAHAWMSGAHGACPEAGREGLRPSRCEDRRRIDEGGATRNGPGLQRIVADELVDHPPQSVAIIICWKRLGNQHVA